MQNFQWLLYVIGISLIADVAIVVYVLRRREEKARQSSHKFKLNSSQKKTIREHWRRIERMFQQDGKSAILEADKLLHYTMKQISGFNGSMGQTLKMHAERYFDNVNDVWGMHKLRNKISHELNYSPSKDEFQQAKRVFKRAISLLGVNL